MNSNFSLRSLLTIAILSLYYLLSASSPYDYMIVGYDNEINKRGDDLVVVYNRVPFVSGSSLTISNFISDDGIIENYNSKPIVLNFKYTSSVPIEAGSLIRIVTNTKTNQPKVYLDRINISSRFDFDAQYSDANWKDLIPTKGGYLSLLTGVIVSSQKGSRLVGHYYNSIGIGMDESSLSNIQISTELQDLGITPINQTGSSTGLLNINGCDVCQILQDIINGDIKWDIKLGIDKLEDLVYQIYPEGCHALCDISTEIVENNCKIEVSQYPCDGLLIYTWQVDEGDGFVNLSNGSGISVPGIVSDIEADYRLIIQCDTIGCKDTSNILSIECFDYLCAPQITGFVIDSDCSNNGSIDLTIDKLEEPISVLWSNGNTGESINNLPPGVYQAIVTGNYDCSDTLLFEVNSCCCFYTFDGYGSNGLSIGDIQVNDDWLSTNSTFNFQYNSTGGSNTIENLIDDINLFESTTSGGGYATLDNNVITIASCNDYQTIIYDDYGKSDGCALDIVEPLLSDCSYTPTLEDCELNMELNYFPASCALEVAITSINNYSITLEWYNATTGKWEVIANKIISNSIFSITGHHEYRLRATSDDGCPEIISCPESYLCCECEISEILAIGASIDSTYCVGVDSLSFLVITAGCSGATIGEVISPSNDTLVLVEHNVDTLAVDVIQNVTVTYEGDYSFTIADSNDCNDILTYEVVITDCSACANCGPTLSITSDTPGSFSATDMTLDSIECGTIDSFQISWYLEDTSDPENRIVISGSQEGVLNHPFENYPTLGGTVIPVIDYISIDGLMFDDINNGTGSCLDTIEVENFNCDNTQCYNYNSENNTGILCYQNLISYNSSNGGNQNLDMAFEVDSLTSYLYLRFFADDFVDTLIITYGEDTLLYAIAGGNNENDFDFFSFPQQLKDKYYYLLVNIEDVYDANIPLVNISVNGYYESSITNWKLYLACVDGPDCGSITPELSDYTCSYDESLCLFSLLVPTTRVYPILPYNYTGLGSIYFSHNYNNCSKSRTTVAYNELECEEEVIDSYDTDSKIFSLKFTSLSAYNDVKDELQDHFDNTVIECEDIYNYDYYRYFRIQLYGGACIEDPVGDGLPTNDFIKYVYVRECEDYFTFNDSDHEIQIEFTVMNSLEGDDNCTDCNDYLEIFANVVDENRLINLDTSLLIERVLFKSNYFKYVEDSLQTEYIRTSKINYYYGAATYCDCNNTNYIKYKLEIHDVNDPCNNFSIYQASDPCNEPNVFDSLLLSTNSSTLVSPDNLLEIQSIIESLQLEEANSGLVDSDQISLIPNPALDFTDINLFSDLISDIRYKVYDMNTQLVVSGETDLLLGVNNIRLDTDGMPPGVYIVAIEVNGKVTTKKLVITK